MSNDRPRPLGFAYLFLFIVTALFFIIIIFISTLSFINYFSYSHSVENAVLYKYVIGD